MFFKLVCLTLLSIACILSGCGTAPKKMDVPAWYLSQTNETEGKLMGVGTGLSKKAAKQRAVEDIVERISIQVETQSESSQTLSLGQLSATYQQQNKTSSARIQLTNIIEEQAVKIGHDYYVQISVKRSDILQSLHEKARLADKAIAETLKVSAEKTRLEAVIALNQKQAQAKELSRLIRLLKALDNTYSGHSHQLRLEQFERKRADVLSQFSVRVNAQKALQPIVQNLQGYLQKQGVLAMSSQPDLDIFLTAESTKHIIYGSTSASVTLTLSLINNKNITFYKETIKANATSVTSYDAAKQIAFIQLSKDVESFNAIKNLGF